MRLSVLVENVASVGFKAEHGLSYFIEADEKILFDTGHSDLFLQNAQKLNIDLASVEKVVLSHGHWDHGNGLQYLKDKTLICHPYALMKRYRKNDKTDIGIKCDYYGLCQKFKFVNTRKPYIVSKDIVFLGEIPRKNSFESQVTSFVDEHGSDDFVMDDSAIVVKSGEEIVVVSGCAHAGICNIVEYAKEVTGIHKVKAVIGGFHLKNNNAQTKETIKYFKEENISEVYPSHCTELPALSAFHSEFGGKQVKSGMSFNF